MNPTVYQLAVAASLRADGDTAGADAIMALSPGEVADIFLGTVTPPPTTFAEWRPYRGPEGGQGWQSSTGEIRYQQEQPDDDDGTGGGTDPQRQDIAPGIDKASRVLGGATVGFLTGSAVGGPLGAAVGTAAGAALGTDTARSVLGGIRSLLNRGEEPEGIARKVTAGDPEATQAVRADAADQVRHAAGELAKLPPADPAEVRGGWAQASVRMRAGDAAELGGHVEALATAREPGAIEAAFRGIGGVLGKLTGGALRLAMGAVKAFGRFAAGSGKPYLVWAASMATGAAVLFSPAVALGLGLISPVAAFALAPVAVAGAVGAGMYGRRVQRTAAAAQFSEWQPYTGPDGGRGWTNGREVRYQDEQPGEGGSSTRPKAKGSAGGGAWSEESPYEPDRTRLDRVMGKAEFLEKQVTKLLDAAGPQGVRLGQLVKQINRGGTVYGNTDPNELAAVMADLGVEWQGEVVRHGPTGDAYGNAVPRFPDAPPPKAPAGGDPALAPALAAFHAAPEGSRVRLAIDNAIANASPAGHDAANPPKTLDPERVRRFRYDLASQHAELSAAGMLTPDDDAAFVKVMGELGIKPLHAPGETKPFDPETMELDGPTVSSGTPVKVARRGWVGLYGDPATGDDLTGKNWRRAKVEKFAEGPADYTPAGPDGKRAVELLAAAKESGVNTLTAVADRAVRRLLMLPDPSKAATLFDDDELDKIAGSLAGSIAAADLLGRSRVRRRAEMAERVQRFAESDPGPPGPPPRPGLTWKRETQRWVRKGAEHAKELGRRVKDAPKELHAKVRTYVRKKYATLEARYGSKGAKAIMAASVLMLPVPVPGASFLPVALAEAVRAVGKGIDRFAEGPVPDEMVQAVLDFLAGLYADAGEEMPAIDAVRVRAALERDEVEDDDAETLAEERDPAPMGYCPECREPFTHTQRHIGAPVFCDNGHEFPRKKAKYSCVMLPLDGTPLGDKLVELGAMIPDADLGEDGRESESHVTARYGLHTSDPEEVRRLVSGFGPVRVTLGNLAAFYGADTGKPYDVIFAEVDSPELRGLHARLGETYHTDTHAEYHPHATVAYVKAGKADEYLSKLGDAAGLKATVSQVKFGDPKRNATMIPLSGVASFAEPPPADPFHDFAEPVPAVEPAQAVDYFRRLVPTLADDPGRYGAMLGRHAFTLAVATEQTLLQKVKDAILAGLRAGTDATPDVQDVLDAAGVSPRNPQYAEMVWRTSAHEALNAGAEAEMDTPEMQEAFPVWRYDGILDSRTGDDHRPMIGKHYPSTARFSDVRGPRPFNCRCTPTPIHYSEAADLIRAGKVERG